MRGCGPQFMDHMRSVSRGQLQILSLASEVDGLKKSSGNKYALLVSKKIQRVAHGPPLGAGPRIAGSAGAVVTPLNAIVLCTMFAVRIVYCSVNIMLHNIRNTTFIFIMQEYSILSDLKDPTSFFDQFAYYTEVYIRIMLFIWSSDVLSVTMKLLNEY